jgi:hypothetical protein
LESRLANPFSPGCGEHRCEFERRQYHRVAQQLNSNDQWTRVEVVSILNKLIDKDFVADINERRTIKSIVEGLQQFSVAGASAVNALESGPAVIPGDRVTHENVEDEAQDSKSVMDRDRDWTDQ